MKPQRTLTFFAVVATMALPALAGEELAALSERLWVGVDHANVAQFGALCGEQAVVNGHVVFADDVQLGSREQIVDRGDSAFERVLDRNHA